ncbi:hypothetical protein NDU88_004589 [Pleurodeles waltl]|uniref:Secreted protein n=1 Tax=Pleurodeles waltl TaxID=8319 RepID=A0AAV7T818_PLEWA|nr:hypothetical protein NDU88_004589 [Pleurodeles waltl]
MGCWAAGWVLWSALCGWGGFVWRKHILCFRVPDCFSCGCDGEVSAMFRRVTGFTQEEHAKERRTQVVGTKCEKQTRQNKEKQVLFGQRDRK